MSEESQDLHERLEALEVRLAELVNALAAVHPDDVARVQSIAEDGLARATNAQAIAEDALARAVGSEGQGADAHARAGNAQAATDEALSRLAENESRSIDALARADNAQALAEDALARAAKAQAGGVDALARADNAQAIADQALQLAAGAQAQAEDAAATAALARDTAREALLPVRVATLDAWLELCPPLEVASISIVLPTRDRPALLPRAVASVLEQLYPRWELVVVDDGDTDAVAKVLANVEDERVRTVEGPRRGLSAARNAGLDAAAGEVVCYLDDDNVMHPGWLQAVAHVLTQRDDVDVLYGVTLAEYLDPGSPSGAARWPGLWQLPWSRDLLLERNVADAGALAHRRELPEARFDESLATGEDWDLLIRLTADRPALAVPAISHAYTLAGEDRMSRDPSHEPGLEAIRRRHAGGG